MAFFDFLRRRKTKRMENDEHKILQMKVDEWLGSGEYETMLAANRYYKGNNDINNRVRMVVGDGGCLVPATNLADNRIPHAFVRDLVDQKTQYLLGSDWSIETDIDAYQTLLDEFFNDRFRMLFRRTAKDAVNKGVGWGFVYLDEIGVCVKRMQPEELIPVWADIDHTELEGMIRVYEQVEYTNNQKKSVRYVDNYTLDGVTHFKYKDGKLEFIEESPHMQGNGIGFNWIKIPFIPFKYNDAEIPLLNVVKPIIDEYDRTVSDTANLLEDEPNGITVISGMQGTDVSTARRNMNEFRLALTDEKGGIDYLATTPNIEASIKHQEKLRSDIFFLGRGFDSNNTEFGANASADARKNMYAQLDTDCNQLEEGANVFLQELIWFFNNNPNRPLPYTDEKVSFKYSRNIAINESQKLDNAIKMQSISGISMETILGTVPGIENPQAEVEKWKLESFGEEPLTTIE